MGGNLAFQRPDAILAKGMAAGIGILTAGRQRLLAAKDFQHVGGGFGVDFGAYHIADTNLIGHGLLGAGMGKEIVDGGPGGADGDTGRRIAISTNRGREA